jgi:hypothetical protein
VRLRDRFGDRLLSAEAEVKRGPGARLVWDDFLDRYFYMHVTAITDRGINLTDAKRIFL